MAFAFAFSVVVVDDPDAIGKTKVENVPEVPEMVPEAAMFVGVTVVGYPTVILPFWSTNKG